MSVIRRPITALFLFLFVAAAAAIWYGRPDSKIECGESAFQNKYVADDQEGGAPEITAHNQLAPTQQGAPDGAEEQNKYDCYVADYTEQLAVFTFWLVTATGFVALATIGLVFSAIVQLRDSRTFKRAYVNVSPLGLHYMKGSGATGIVAHLSIKNMGHLPARNLRNAVEIRWSDQDDLAIFPEVALPHEGILLLPQSEIMRGTKRISKEGVDNFDRGHGFIYVSGRVEYEDGLGEPRWLIFCHRYNCSSPKNKDDGIDAVYGRLHHRHNDGT